MELKGHTHSDSHKDASIPLLYGPDAKVLVLESQKPQAPALSNNVKALLYGLLNVVSTVSIVFANKLAMDTFGFRFPVALTWCHSIFTAIGMELMCQGRLFERKKVPLPKVIPVAAVYVGFIVFNNISLKINTVGFYQITKIAITPVVILVEAIFYQKYPSRQAIMSTGLLLGGVALATVTDQQVASNTMGVMIGCTATLMSALYQIWAGSKQRELGLSGNQLLHQSAPSAVVLLTALIPALEPVGWQVGPDGRPPAGTLLGYEYSVPALGAIFVSSVLGLLVTLSAFLVIGATSPLTYNVVGHLKTVLIVAGGIMFFGDSISPIKMTGLSIALSGIVWYTTLQAPGKPAASTGGSGTQVGGPKGAAGGPLVVNVDADAQGGQVKGPLLPISGPTKEAGKD